MSAPSNPLPDSAPGCLQHGQALEAAGSFAAALIAYDRAIALWRTAVSEAPSDISLGRALGVAWMNRGNALQKLAAEQGRHGRPQEQADARRAAVAAYDDALATFRALPWERDATLRNHLGAAALNRGHALLGIPDLDTAHAAFEAAAGLLEKLPLADDPSYRLNLAGARTNLAHVRLQGAEAGRNGPGYTPAQAADAARSALAGLAEFETAHVLFAEMSLRARRALVVALGAQLVAAEANRAPTHELATEASDVIDDGLALARTCEQRGASHLRPLSFRLFRLGAQLYLAHQPHFLAEFLLENVDPHSDSAVFAGDPDFRALADEALARGLADLQRPNLVVAGTRDAERLVATARALRGARQHLSAATLPSSSVSS